MKTETFDNFACTSSGRRAASLLRDHKVKPEQLFAMVLAEVTQNLPHLEEGGRYTTEMLCGPDIWAALFEAERSVAGMCLSYLVRKKVIPLYRHLTASGKGPAKYRTTPAPELVGQRDIKIVRRRRISSGGMPCR